MKTMKLIAALILTFFVISCQGERGPAGIDGIDGGWSDATTDTPLAVVSNPTGKAENGPFKKDSGVYVYPLSSEWKQDGPDVKGYTESDDGSYQIHADLTSQYGRFEISGSAYNQVGDGYQDIDLRLIANMSAGYFNINPLTNLQSVLVDSSDGYFWDEEHECYQSPENALSQARVDILEYFKLPDYGVNFSAMSLQGDTTADAVMFIADTVVVGGRDGPTQKDWMREVASGIINGDLTIKQEISDTIASIKFKAVCDNIVNAYADIGITMSCPPVWQVEYQGENVLPSYYELLSRTPTVLRELNMGATIDVYSDSEHKAYAVPVWFTAGAYVETANYIAAEFNEGDLSFWTVGVDGDGKPCPDTKVVDVTEFREILLSEPQELRYNGALGSHGLVSNEYYYAVISKDDPFTLEKAGDGDSVPFGVVLYSDDGGETWGGANASGPFEDSALQFYITN